MNDLSKLGKIEAFERGEKREIEKLSTSLSIRGLDGMKAEMASRHQLCEEIIEAIAEIRRG